MHHPISRRGFLAGSSAALVALASSSPDAAAAVTHNQDFRSRFISLRGAHPVPSVAIPLINNKSIDLTAFRGSRVIVNFWATWCPGCRQELPALQGLAAKQLPGLKIVAIAADREPPRKIAEFAKGLGLSKLAIGLAPESLINRKDSEQVSPFVLYAMPITYVIGTSGAVEGYFLGQVDWSGDEALTFIERFN